MKCLSLTLVSVLSIAAATLATAATATQDVEIFAAPVDGRGAVDVTRSAGEDSLVAVSPTQNLMAFAAERSRRSRHAEPDDQEMGSRA